MATTKTSDESINIDDFEALLEALSAEELENVNDFIDPEVSIVFFFFFTLLIIIIF